MNHFFTSKVRKYIFSGRSSPQGSEREGTAIICSTCTGNTLALCLPLLLSPDPITLLPNRTPPGKESWSYNYTVPTPKGPRAKEWGAVSRQHATLRASIKCPADLTRRTASENSRPLHLLHALTYEMKLVTTSTEVISQSIQGLNYSIRHISSKFFHW